MYDRQRSGQFLFFELTSAVSGNAVTGQAAGISGRVAADDGSQAVLAGTVSEVGGGQYRANLFLNDTSGNNLGFFFTASGCVPRSFTVLTQQNVSGRLYPASGANATVPPASLSGVSVTVPIGTISGTNVVVPIGSVSGINVVVPPANLSGVFASVPIASISGVNPASGAFVSVPIASVSGINAVIPISTISGVNPASGAFVSVPIGSISGTNAVVPITSISGLTAVVLPATLSGVFASVPIASISGTNAVVPPANLSGVHATVPIASVSGINVIVPAGQLSGGVWLPSGSLFADTFASGFLNVEVADRILRRDFTASSGIIASGLSGRSLLQASRKLTNLWDTSAQSGYLVIYQEDDTAIAFRQAFTEASGANPISKLDTV